MNSQIIEDFIDHSTSVPRDVIRICKLLKQIDETSNKLNASLDQNRQYYLANKKGKSENLEQIKIKIDSEYKKLIELSEYKVEQIKELEFIIQTHMTELSSSIIEYEKDYRDTWKCSPNLGNSNFENGFQEPLSASIHMNGVKKSHKKANINGRDKSRIKNTSNSHKSNLANGATYYTNGTQYSSYNEEFNDLPLLEDIPPEEPTELYCFCQKQCFNEMIGCDNKKCKYQWFHVACVGLSELPEGSWYCPECRDKMKKKKR